MPTIMISTTAAGQAIREGVMEVKPVIAVEATKV